MPTYQIVSEDTIKDDSGRFIPVDPLNADYQDYLAWVAAGNTATNFSPPSNTDTIYIYGNASVGNSEVYDGTDGSFLYNNNGVLGERATTGSSAVVLSQGATITNPTINTPTITGNLYVGSTPYQGDANSVLTATGTGVEWNFSSGIGDVVRNITPTITGLELVGTLTADGEVGAFDSLLTSTGAGVQWVSCTGIGNPVRASNAGLTDLTLSGVLVASNGEGASGQLLQSTGTGVQWATVPNLKNVLINGDFAIDQRVRPGDSVAHVSTSAFPNNDDAYTLDRWYILSDGNDIVDVTQATDAPTNQLTSIGLDVETINKKFGIAQIIEQSNCVGLIGQNVSLSFKARVTSTTKLNNIKAAIISWSGTADTVTSDIISAWGAGGTNPTLIANATYENSPANLSVTTSWATYKIENVAIDTASAKNIIVLIWSDVTDTTLGDFIYITDVQLEAGNVATPYDRLPIDAQLQRCLRYTYGLWQTAALASFGVGLCTATNKFDTVISYPVPMRGTPSATYSAGTTFQIYTTGAFAANSILTSRITQHSLHMQATRTAADLTGGAAGLFRDANSGTFAYVVVSAEL